MTIYYSTELYHYGILGQKWGIRRYQNEDGSLTEAGKKRYYKDFASDREATSQKGAHFYRISTNKNDLNAGKIYVNNTKEKGDFYIANLGPQKIFKEGHAFVQEYESKTEIHVPDKKTMEKIELGLLKDKEVRQELVDSLMKKGYTRESATRACQEYKLSSEFIRRVKDASFTGFIGAVYGATIGGSVGGGIGALVGAGAVATAMALPTMLDSTNLERKRALDIVRTSYGDVNNKKLNAKLESSLKSQGYNAIKDYNDRRAFGNDGKQAVIIFDSKNNLKLKSSKKLDAKTYGEAYAREYLKAHPKSKLNFNDLVKDGEKYYNDTYERGIVARNRKEIEAEVIKNQKEKDKNSKS